MVPLRFRLKVPSRDYSDDASTAWSTDRVHGLLDVEDGLVRLQWAGTSHLDEVDGLTVHTETVELEPRHLALPLLSLRSVRLFGWWHPRLELTTGDLNALRDVPGASGGRVLLWVSRRDRPLARRTVEVIRQAARAHTDRQS